MGKYDIDMKRLAVLLLPTALRQPRLTALAQALVAPLSGLLRRLTDYREAKDYRLRHNGQVCHLRAVLNDRFDKVGRGISILDELDGENAILLHQRYQNREIVVFQRVDGVAQRVVYRRDYGGIGSLDFWVSVPNAVRTRPGYSEDELCALTNLYKLASKRYGIIYN